MKVWRFTDPCDDRFARVSRVGGMWQEGEYFERRNPIIIEWEPGSDTMGDFSWPGLATEILITGCVGQVLSSAQTQGFELRPVKTEAVAHRSRKPIVSPPYPTGLFDLWVTNWTSIDLERSTAIGTPGNGGIVNYEVSGVQRIEKVWDGEAMELVTHIHPRVDGHGLYVPSVRGVFRIKQFPAWVFCTDNVKCLIEEHGFTNTAFLEMGDVLE